MKKHFLAFALCVACFVGCKETTPTPQATPAAPVVIDWAQANFSDLFEEIDPKSITDNVFKLVGDDWTAITAMTDTSFNSMTASYGGFGMLFEMPTTWCFLRANRYTLELIKQRQTYTMSYFDEQYRDQLKLFGSKSGRDSKKMSESTLNSVVTPLGNTSYKQARLIIECELMEITTVNPKDFYNQKGKEFVEAAFVDSKDYHKLVFGKITKVWKAIERK